MMHKNPKFLLRLSKKKIYNIKKKRNLLKTLQKIFFFLSRLKLSYFKAQFFF